MDTRAFIRPAVLSMNLLSVTALAQSGNPGGMAPDTPGLEAAKPAANYANNQDKLFVKLAAEGGQAEIDLSRIAQKKASSDVVRKFADRMVEDHGKSNDRLIRSGRGLKLEIPKEAGVLDPEHKTVRTEVERANGEDFDRAYLASQIQNHQKTANLLLWELSTGQNQELTKFAADTLPVVLDHLEMAKRHYAELNSVPPGR